jgi:hypothetical protein
MLNGLPDCVELWDGLTRLIESAAAATNTERPRVAILGECAGLTYTEGNVEAAIQLEKAANDVLKTHNVDFLCPYPLSAVHSNKEDHAFRRICEEHTAVHSH